MDIQKAFAITDAKISFVSLVDKAANKKQFLITKAADGQANFSTYGKIVKTDNDSHFVTGIVYEPMSEDAHGNYMTADEIQKAAYWYTKNSNKVDLQHTFKKCEGADVVESWIAKSDCKIGDTEIKKGTWLMTMEITDTDIWDSIQKGEITGFSMGGIGKYSDTDDDIVEKQNVLQKIAKFLGIDTVRKGMKETFEAKTQRKSDLFWDAWYSLQENLCRYDRFADKTVFENDQDNIKTALQEFTDIVIDILSKPDDEINKSLIPVEKAGKKISSSNREKLKNAYESLGKLLKETEETEEIDMDAKDIQKMIDDSIAKALTPQVTQPAATPATEPITTDTITKMVEDAVKKAMEPETKPTEVTAENLEQTVTDAVAKAMAPILAQRGISQNLNGEPVTKAQDEPHYMAGIF